jgi:hypothetical protein
MMAGQSNMVGHANGHTMATSFNADGPKDEALAKPVFGKDAKISKKRFDETLALAKQLNGLHPKSKFLAVVQSSCGMTL